MPSRTAVDRTSFERTSADAISLQLSPDRRHLGAWRLADDAERCIKLATSVRDPAKHFALTAVAGALSTLASAGDQGALQGYMLSRSLDAFFDAVEHGNVPAAFMREVQRALRSCGHLLRFSDPEAEARRTAIRAAEHNLVRATRLLRAKLLDARRTQRPALGSSPRSLVVTLTIAPSAPPASLV